MNTRHDLTNGFRLAEWEVEPARNRISGPEGHANVSPKAMDVLVCLAERAGEVVSRDQFNDEIWHPSVVSDYALTHCISELRHHLGETASDCRYIETIPKRGYRLRVAPRPIREHEGSSGSDHQSPVPGAPSIERRLAGSGNHRRPARYRLVLLVTLLVLSVGLALWYLPRSTPPEDSVSRLAVLPFENLTSEPDNASIAGGLHEELLTQLSKIEEISLRGRTSVMGYAETTKPVPQIAEELDVDALIEGSVQVVDGRLRVNVQLIDAASDEHLWAERYDRTLDDVFAVQSDIVNQVVEALDVTLFDSDREAIEARPTDDPEAYGLYVRGREYERMADRNTALELFERAVDLDPEFALAHAAIAQIHLHKFWHGPGRPRERLDKARAALDRSLELDPELPEAHLTLAYYHYWVHRDYERALAEVERAREGLSENRAVFSTLGSIYRRQGRWVDSIEALREAVRLDPRSAGLNAAIGTNLLYLRDYPEAQTYLQRAIALFPEWGFAHRLLAWSHLQRGAGLEAARSVVKDALEISDLVGEPHLFWMQLRLDLLARDFQGLLDRTETAPVTEFDHQLEFVPVAQFRAYAHRGLGNAERAREEFEAARARVDEKLEQAPDDPRLHSALGLALAGLGRNEEAVTSGRRGVDLLPIELDAVEGIARVADLARIYTMVGEHEQAIETLETLLEVPSYLSAHVLKLDPAWDPLREEPRFRALLDQGAE